MSEAILTLNVGSSSVKYALYAAVGDGAAFTKGHIDRIGLGPVHHVDDISEPLPLPAEADHEQVLDWLVRHLQEQSAGLKVIAAGHRVVHGGQRFADATRVTADVRGELERLAPLVPAHQPHNLAGIDALQRAWPGIPQIACFDTAFHRTTPRIGQIFALPRALTDAGVLRYGFHGLSYEFIASQLPTHLGKRADGRVLVLHLGHGASICAMKNRKSIATTMGFTALDGLVMGKRCGELDPGVPLYLMREKGMSLEEVEALLGAQSGLLGVSGISDDMRDLLESDSPDAKEAVELFVYRACKQIGALAAAAQGIDALVFTGGMGENAAEIRARIVEGCGWLGATLDTEANARNDTRIHGGDSTVGAYVIATDEERVIADHVRTFLSDAQDGAGASGHAAQPGMKDVF